MASEAAAAETPEFSRLFIYDVRGPGRDETALLLELRGGAVSVWLNDYMGKRTGSVPLQLYLSYFGQMRQIQEFALKKEYRGRLLRTNAARGTITLAWKDSRGKQMRTIRYYAPERTLDDFRNAFNQLWGLSRFAILSLNSFENSKHEYREDALAFLAGGGWMTAREIQDVVNYHLENGHGRRLAAAIWSALDLTYPSASEFRERRYLEDCVARCLSRLGPDGLAYLETTSRHPELARKIIRRNQSAGRMSKP